MEESPQPERALHLVTIALSNERLVQIILLIKGAYVSETGMKPHLIVRGRSQKVSSILARMSLEHKIGQMIMVGFHGTAPSNEVRTLIERNHIGGVILFSRNVRNPRQIAMLTGRLQKIAQGSESPLPLLISTDQEGGLVARIWHGAAVHPGNMALGATRSTRLSCTAGDITGKELRAMGINMNLAPVLDVNNNPANPVIGVRSFGDTSSLVARLGAAMIRGLQNNKVIATAKHFPGHGDTSQDSHEILPVLLHSIRRLVQIEFKPFQTAVSEGVKAVMVGHLSIPAIDRTRNLPATMSSRIVTDLLRQRLGHRGLIISDCMEMKAITGNFEPGEAAVKAVKAGVDLVLVSHTMKRQLEALRTLCDATRNGEISEQRINSSVTRIFEAKAFARQGHAAGPGIGVVGSRKHLQAVNRIARESITVTRNRRILPLTMIREKRILSVSFIPTPFASYLTDFSNMLRRYLPPHAVIRGINCDPKPSKKEINAIRKEMSWAELAIAASHDASHNEAQAGILQEISATIPLVLISTREPYDVIHVPQASAHVAAYSPAKCSIVAAVEVITGRLRVKGRLPVSVPSVHAV